MPNTFHAVSPSFLALLAPVTSDGAGGLLYGEATLYPRVSDNPATLDRWALGTGAGITMSAATLAELQSATARGDGTYTVGGVVRALYLTETGAAEPGLPPPPKT